MNIRRPAPDLPDRPSVRRPPGQSLVRAAYAVAKTKNLFGNPVDTARELFPDDRAAVALLTRTDKVPANITAGVWGSNLSGQAVGEFISSLGPMSAAARLIDAGVRLSITGGQSVLLPKRDAATPAVDVGWVGPGEPIGVVQRAFTSVQLGPPKKLAAMVVVTWEVLNYSSGEQVLGQMLREDIAATLDASMFDDTSSDATRPDGLLVGVTPLDASTATAPYDKMIEDLSNLSGAIVDAGGSGENIAFIMSPRQATFARLNLRSNDPVTVWASTGLVDGDIVAIQTDAFCSAFSAEPSISLAKEATLHMANPAGELSPATSGVSVPADPMLSLFSQDLVGIRVTLPAAWCLRAPLVAYIGGVGWGLAGGLMRPLASQLELNGKLATRAP
jgi:hypothetical protein